MPTTSRSHSSRTGEWRATKRSRSRSGSRGVRPPSPRRGGGRRRGRAALQLPKVVVGAGRLRRRLGLGQGAGVGRLVVRRVRIDVLLNREHGVEQALDLGLAVLELVAPDAVGVEGDGVEHAARGAGEVGIVGEEVGVAEDMGGDQLVLDRGVALEQEGPAGIRVDHQLVDLGETVVVHRLLHLVHLAVGPMREAARHQIRADLVDDAGGDELEVGREGAQPDRLRLVPDPLDGGGEGGVRVGGGGAVGELAHQAVSWAVAPVAASTAKKARRAG